MDGLFGIFTDGTMVSLGKFVQLKILRNTKVGLFLGDSEGNEVLLPGKYVPKTYEIGEQLQVFCYLDHSERPVATTLKPEITLGEFQLLQVAEVNEYGAFMDWGLEKHLLLPFREQTTTLIAGDWYIVHCYLDQRSGRLVASMRLDRFLTNTVLTVRQGQVVDLLFTRFTNLGWEVIINHRHKGLVYANEIFKDIAAGDMTKGVVKKIRPDHKIDISLQPLGVDVLEPAAEKIIKTLEANGGFLPLHDKSDPERIKKMLQMSKKTFKKGIGTLYKARRIQLRQDGIELV